jgi:hypothetical protein
MYSVPTLVIGAPRLFNFSGMKGAFKTVASTL